MGDRGADPLGDERWSGCHGDVFALDDDEARERAVTEIGRPSELTAETKLTALSAWSRWHDSLIAYLATGGPADGERLLAEWQASVQDDEAIASSIYEARMRASMGGQLFVRTIEVPESAPSTRALRDPGPTFLRLPFEEAVRQFLARRVVDGDEFRAMSDAERQAAFTATRLASQQLRARAKALIDQTLADGGTFEAFAAAMQDAESSLGITPSSPWYLETVYRTNVQQAYGAGRLEQLERPEVKAARPFVQYRTAGDTRVRPAHAALNGIIFDRSADPGWRKFAPPLGFSCRCSVVAVPRHRVDQSRIVDSSTIPQDAGAPTGWTGPGTA